MLYRRAVRSARQAAEAIEGKDVPAAHAHLIQAQAIIFELRAALRQDAGPVAEGLDSLYDYFLRRLMQANVEKDRSAALEVAALLESLLDGWEGGLDRPGSSRAR